MKEPSHCSSRMVTGQCICAGLSVHSKENYRICTTNLKLQKSTEEVNLAFNILVFDITVMISIL